MARVFVCDRCKKPETPLERGRQPWQARHTATIIVGLQDSDDDPLANTGHVELCEDCRKDFESWLKLKTS